MTDQWSWIDAELATFEAAGLMRQRRCVEPMPNGRCRVDGRLVWDFASNDYLGLATDPRVVVAAAGALQSHGLGAKASPLVCGRSELQAELESRLAEFEGTDAAVVFPTGTAANIGTIAALASTGDAIFCDRLNHASLIDGCRLSGARVRIYRHQDLSRLNSLLEREAARRKFIVTDSVFSMDGDQAPLVELCAIAEHHGAMIILDEAHGTGVFGLHGRGVAEAMGVEDRIAVRIGTLSKGLGGLGGFVAGRRSLVDYLWNRARTQVYSTALPPSVCAGVIAAIDIVRTEPSRRDRLGEISRSFRQTLQQRGIEPLAGSVGPIVPIVLNDPRTAVLLADRLRDLGYMVGAIRPPTVPHGTSRLRITLRYGISDEIAANLAQAIADARQGGAYS